MLYICADLLNVFEVFLPQLLLYPNPSDPLNGDAASLMMKDQKQYEQKVKGEYFYLSPEYVYVEVQKQVKYAINGEPFLLWFPLVHNEILKYKSRSQEKPDFQKH